MRIYQIYEKNGNATLFDNFTQKMFQKLIKTAHFFEYYIGANLYLRQTKN